MKKVKINGKLKLNKEVVSHLNAPQMHGVKGGAKPYTQGLNCKTRNTLSYGALCTKWNVCEEESIYSRGIFCVK